MNSILLLHGAIGSMEQLQPLKEALSHKFKVYTLNFSGHGGKPFAQQFSIEQFAAEVLEWMEQQKIASIPIFGYSMGGYVAMYLAIHHPHAVKAIATLATKFHWDEAIASKEAGMLNAEKIAEKLPKFAESLKERHKPVDWKELLQKTADMLKEMGSSNPFYLHQVKDIACPVLLMLGDRDNMVTLVETVTVFKELKQGQLAVLPATPHPLEQADVALVSCFIEKAFG